MAWYHNNTRFDAIVTIRITEVVDPDALKIGLESAMKSIALKVGIHDVLVGPGEVIDKVDGVNVDFISARCAP